MKSLHRFCMVWAWFALAGSGVLATEKNGVDAVWQVAWRAAAAVESLIDAGRAKLALQTLAVQEWAVSRAAERLGQGGEGWVEGGLYALASVASRLGGDAELGARWLGEAQRLIAAENEWRRLLARRELAMAEAVAVLLSGADGKPDLEVLRAWVSADREARAYSAVWACSEWTVRRASASDKKLAADGDAAVVKAALEWMADVQIEKRAAVLARLAPALAACGMSGEAVSKVEGWLAGVEPSHAGDVDFEVLVHGAYVCAVCGAGTRARELFSVARDRLNRGQTGESYAPESLLAAALARSGLAVGTDRELWFDGIKQAVRRPGYHRRVALALACARFAMANVGWSEADATRACRLAVEAGALE